MVRTAGNKTYIVNQLLKYDHSSRILYNPVSNNIEKKILMISVYFD